MRWIPLKSGKLNPKTAELLAGRTAVGHTDKTYLRGARDCAKVFESGLVDKPVTQDLREILNAIEHFDALELIP